MRRRKFIAVLGGAAAWPFAVRAQQPAIPVIGFLRSTSLAPFQDLVATFADGLKEAGFIDGENVRIEYRYADNQPHRLPGLVMDLINLPAAVLVVNAGAAFAAKAATTTIPIVFAAGTDPVKDGLIASLNKPGGNITGVSWLGMQIGGKRLELLHQVIPKTPIIGMLVNRINPEAQSEQENVQAAAQALRLKLIMVEVSDDDDIDKAFVTFSERGAGAVLVGSGAFLSSKRDRIVPLAARRAIPAMYVQREDAVAGGLMSYGPSQSRAYHQAGMYAGRILKGEKPGDLPVVQAAKFEFVLNLKTAKALGIEVPMMLQMTADEVIE